MNLARGAAEAVTRWTDAVTQLAGFVICQTCALPIWTQFRVAFALSLQKHDELAVVDACCLTHLKYNKHIKKSFNQSHHSIMLPMKKNHGCTVVKKSSCDGTYTRLLPKLFILTPYKMRRTRTFPTHTGPQKRELV